MSDTLAKQVEVEPSAVPTDEELRTWAELPRDEQLRRLRLALSNADSATAADATMSDILAVARARADDRHG